MSLSTLSFDLASLQAAYRQGTTVREVIAEALRQQGGSLARTAEALRVPKTTLHDKIRKYGLGS